MTGGLRHAIVIADLFSGLTGFRNAYNEQGNITVIPGVE
jgi:hypothetical protein